MLKEKHIGVLLGGISMEREVSLKTGEAIFHALKERGYRASLIFVGEEIERVIREAKIDVAFIALHGKYGEDGCIQGLLELMRIPYTGSGVMASSLAMNKVKSKELFRFNNLSTPSYYVLHENERDELVRRHNHFGFPVVVKPSAEGSSVGVRIVHNLDGLIDAVNQAFAFDEEVLVERFIEGCEVSVGILDGKALGAVEIESIREFYDYEAKYEQGYTKYHLPPRTSATRYANLLTLGEKAHSALGCSGVTRVDMIISECGNEYLLEVNTLPGMTQTSLIPKIAKPAGLDFPDVVEYILFSATLNGRRAFPRPTKLSELIPSISLNKPI